MALLDALSAHSDPVSLKHLARATGLHPSTAHRILNDLVIGRYVIAPTRRVRTGRYALLELGNLVKARCRCARPHSSRCASFTSAPGRR